LLIRKLSIADVLLCIPKKHTDERGYFSEVYKKSALRNFGVDVEFVQDNFSVSLEKYVLRGLHFQIPPYAQDKLVRVSRGAVLDVAVDLRHGSPTYAKHVSVVLNASEGHQLFIPKGFAHGFCTLEPNTEFCYKVSNEYAPDHDKGLIWNDGACAIDWTLPENVKPIVSNKDEGLPGLEELPVYFRYGQSN